MKHTLAFLFLFSFLVSSVHAAQADKSVFGPKQFDVLQRNGLENRYQETFPSAEGRYLLKIQNGEPPKKLGSTFIELRMNDQVVLKDDRYAYPFTICAVGLKKENKLELVLKDAVPMAAKAPKPPARATTISVLPLTITWPDGIYGVSTWEQLNDLDKAFQKMGKTESYSLAVKVINLKLDQNSRAEAMRSLADRKDPAALDFFKILHDDLYLNLEIKGEVAVARGKLLDRGAVEKLTNGLLDEAEPVRVGSARALSLYPEEDVREPLIKVLQTLDAARWGMTLSSVSEGGLKHVGTFIKMAESSDQVTQNIGFLLLGDAKSSQAVDYLLELLKNPGKKDRNAIIKALGESKSQAALEPLMAIARDAKERFGVQAALGVALASLGDQNSAPLIGEMINEATDKQVRRELRIAYRKLTGTKYKKD